MRTKKHEKINKICRNDISAFALRNNSECYEINKTPFRQGNALG